MITLASNLTKKCDWFELKNIARFISWTESPVGKYVEDLWMSKDKIHENDLLFFDVEFSMLRNGEKRPKVVVWFEIDPQNNSRRHDVAWWYDKASINRLRSAFNRGDHVIAYNPSDLDYRVLGYWGINVIPILSKTIDIYRFFFQALSWPGTGSLCTVSQMNGGPGKYPRKDASPAEFQKQCERDVEMLIYMFDLIMSGTFKCSKYGVINLEEIWPTNPPGTLDMMALVNMGIVEIKCKIAASLNNILRYLPKYLEIRGDPVD